MATGSGSSRFAQHPAAVSAGAPTGGDRPSCRSRASTRSCSWSRRAGAIRGNSRAWTGPSISSNGLPNRFRRRAGEAYRRRTDQRPVHPLARRPQPCGSWHATAKATCPPEPYHAGWHDSDRQQAGWLSMQALRKYIESDRLARAGAQSEEEGRAVTQGSPTRAGAAVIAPGRTAWPGRGPQPHAVYGPVCYNSVNSGTAAGAGLPAWSCPPRSQEFLPAGKKSPQVSGDGNGDAEEDGILSPPTGRTAEPGQFSGRRGAGG